MRKMIEKLLSVITAVEESDGQHWRLKPEALGSIPGGATFPFKPLPFQRSTDGGGPDCVVD